MGRRKTHEEFVRDYISKHPNVEVVSKYIAMENPITLHCKKCGYIWTKLARLAYGCPNCEHKRRKRTNTHEDYLQKLEERNITNIIPLEKYKATDIKIKHKCCKCGYEWYIKPNNVLSGYGCPACAGEVVVKGRNDLWTTNPDVARLLANPEDGYKYSQYSAKKVDWKCPQCGSIVHKRIISNITQQGLRCDRCSDGRSIPNKLIANVLDSLNIIFETEKSFIWSQNRRYDIYIPDVNCIIEMNGLQHNGCGFETIGGRTLGEEQENDKFKKMIAQQNGIDDNHYIIIDARKSELSYMKNNILHSNLIKFFDFSQVDWNECFKLSQNSLVVNVVNLWNKGYRTPDICSQLHLSTVTVDSYLHIGNELNLCKYSGNGEKYKKVICLTTGDVFDSIKAASKYFGIESTSHIGGCCRGERNYCGTDKATNKKLKWMYYDDYINN